MNGPVDISPNHLRVVAEILHKNVPSGVTIWVFGSRASWTTSDSSDLDLALEGNIDHDTILKLEMAFEESSLPYKVDIIDLNLVNDKFKQIVDAQKVHFPINWYLDNIINSQNQVTGSDDTLVVEIEPDLNLVDSEKMYNQNEWQSVNLRDCMIINDESYSPKEAWPFINYLDTKNIYENHINKIQKIEIAKDVLPSRARRKVKLGDIVYSMVRPNQKHFGLIKKIPENFLVSTGFAVLRGMNNIADTDFVYWFLTQDHIIKHLHSIAEDNTTAYPAIRPSDLEAVSLLIPSLPEQRTIVSILRALNNKIELNRRMHQTLEKMARALFKSWFVDFDPVRAKMDGRWFSGELLPGLPACIYNLFPSQLVDSEMGEIPNGWEVKSLRHYAILNPESWSRTNTPKEVEYIDLANVKSGVIKSTNHYLWKNAPSRAQRILRPGDTIVGTVRPGNKSYALVGGSGLTGSTGFAVLRPLRPEYRELVYLASTAPNNIKYLAHRADGAAYPAVRPKVVSDTGVAVPLADKNVDILNQFSNIVAPIVDKMLSANIENNILAFQRDTLLPKLMSGEIRVTYCDGVAVT